MVNSIDESDARAVEAAISYVTRDSLINRRFVAPGAERNTGRYQTHPVAIHDGRAIRITSAWMFMVSPWRNAPVP